MSAWAKAKFKEFANDSDIEDAERSDEDGGKILEGICKLGDNSGRREVGEVP